MTTLAQQKAVAIAPKITAFASILGSSTAAFLVWKRDTTKTTYHRLVLGMSIVDLIASIAWFFTTWRKCRGFASLYNSYHYWIAAILLINILRNNLQQCVLSSSSQQFHGVHLVFTELSEINKHAARRHSLHNFLSLQ